MEIKRKMTRLLAFQRLIQIATNIKTTFRTMILVLTQEYKFLKTDLKYITLIWIVIQIC